MKDNRLASAFSAFVRRLTSRKALGWFIYLGMLAVPLPNTAWMFRQFEPTGLAFSPSWLVAIAFEAAIAYFAHRVVARLEDRRRKESVFANFLRNYLNINSVALFASLVVSGMANYAHAVEFTRAAVLFTGNAWVLAVYRVVFGAALPVISLLFAGALANEPQEDASEASPELLKARQTIAEQKAALAEGVRERKSLEAKMAELQSLQSAYGAILARLFAQDKAERILAASQLWPALPQRSIALMTDASVGYVSEVLKAGAPVDVAAD